jgi:hypothetical protein
MLMTGDGPVHGSDRGKALIAALNSAGFSLFTKRAPDRASG